ncbi:MAG: oligosaccharide flippase family protein [Deltaproteobacteria bacterium]
MSVAKHAARGVAWNMLFGVTSRMIQLVGTLILTRFIAPAEYGDVLTASIAVMTAGVLTSFAFGQNIIAKNSPPEVAFQAMVLHVGIGIGAMVLVCAAQQPIGDFFDTPKMGHYIYGYALAHLFDRARYVPERLIMRSLKFRTIASTNAIGELLFTALALAFARPWGAKAIEFAAVIRSIVQCILYFRASPKNEWLVPTRLRRADVKDLFGYGLPIMVAAVSDRAATRWDNLIMTKLFDAAVMARYNLAYSLAEMPVNNIAEQIGEVLMPSFSRMEESQRARNVVRTAALMAVIVTPLGVGLGAVSNTVVACFFDARWAPMAPMLLVLSVMTVFRPTMWSAIAYIQAVQKTRLVMFSSFFRAVVVLSGVALGGALGDPVWACVGGGIGYALHAIVTIVVSGLVCKFSVRDYLVGVARPLIPCVPMFLAVIGIAHVLADAPRLVSLISQVATGAVVYTLGAFVFLRPAVDDILRLGREAIGKRKAS